MPGSSPLFGAEGLSDLLESWLAVESELYRWQDSVNDTAAGDTAEKTAASAVKLLSALEQFSVSLNDFTDSLLFVQYERTGLLAKESGGALCRMTGVLAASVERASTEANPASAAAAARAAIREAAEIRQVLYSWFRMDSQISSLVFNRFVWVTGVFLFCIIALTIAMWLLYRALHRSQMQEQDSTDFSRTSMLFQEKERALISAELHDTVLQDLGQLIHISKDPVPGSLTELSQKIMTRARELCRTLMPPDFSRLALTDTLLQLCADFEQRTSVECRAIIARNFSLDHLSPEMQLQVYRIVQESLVNIEKHANAKEVSLTALNKEGKALLIYISDDGIGLPEEENPRTQQPARGLGIRGMYHRAAMLGANLTFVSDKESGLTVRLELP